MTDDSYVDTMLKLTEDPDGKLRYPDNRVVAVGLAMVADSITCSVDMLINGSWGHGVLTRIADALEQRENNDVEEPS